MFKSLRSRLTLIMIVLAIVPLVGVGALLSYNNFTTQQNQALALEHQISLRVGSQIQAFIAARDNELRVLNEIRGLRDLNPDDQKTILSSLLNYQQIYNEVALLDQSGQEQIRLSRLAVFGPGDLRNLAGEDAFNVPFTTRETFYSPVQLDPTTDEPYMTIAVPLVDQRTNVVTNVLVAQFRFNTVWNLIADVPVKGAEEFYLVDAQGRIVAHRNPSVVLSGTHFTVPSSEGVHTGLQKDQAIVAFSKIQIGQQEFTVVGDVPTSQAFRDATRTLELLVIGLVGVLIVLAVIGLFVGRQMTRPLEALAGTARTLGGGDLSQRAALSGRTEIDALAQALNTMASQIQELVSSLEGRVQARTKDLQLAAQVSEQVSSILDVDQLLPQVVDLTRSSFNLYHAHVYLLDEKGAQLLLAAGAGDVGRIMKAGKHSIPATTERSLVARAARENNPVIVDDVTEEPGFLPNPLLPNTRSEAAFPLAVGSRVLGVLDVQSEEVARFDANLLSVLSTLAGQVGVALDNARLFSEVERTGRHERALGAITQQMQQANSVDEVLQTAIRELGKALRVSHTAIELRLPSRSEESRTGTKSKSAYEAVRAETK